MDMRPSKRLSALAAFGGFWLTMSIFHGFTYLFDVPEDKLRDIFVPLSLAVGMFTYWEARFKP